MSKTNVGTPRIIFIYKPARAAAKLFLLMRILQISAPNKVPNIMLAKAKINVPPKPFNIIFQRPARIKFISKPCLIFSIKADSLETVTVSGLTLTAK